MAGHFPGKPQILASQRLLKGRLWFASFCCAALAMLLVIYSPLAAQGAREGLLICAQVIIPTLFPFFVLSGAFTLLARRRAALRAPQPGRSRLMERLFRQPSAAFGALLIGILGGYPMGARAAAQLHESGLLSRRQAQCLQLYCVNAGPAYLVGVVGSALLNSRRAGMIAFASLSLASLLLGIATRFLIHEPSPDISTSAPASAPQGFAFQAPAAPQALMINAIEATLHVCAWVVLFSCLCALLRLLPLALHPAIPAANALLEVSSGVVQAVRAGMPLPVTCAVLGWAGLSVHCQILGDLRKTGLRLRWFWSARAIHGTLAAAICAELLRLFPPDAGVAAMHAVPALRAGGRAVELWAVSAPAAAAMLFFCAFLILDLDPNRRRGIPPWREKPLAFPPPVC